MQNHAAQLTTLDEWAEVWFLNCGIPATFAEKVQQLAIDPHQMTTFKALHDERMPSGPIGRALDVAWHLATDGQWQKAAIAAQCDTTVKALESAWDVGGWGFIYE